MNKDVALACRAVRILTAHPPGRPCCCCARFAQGPSKQQGATTAASQQQQQQQQQAVVVVDQEAWKQLAQLLSKKVDRINHLQVS
jgi:hypothetical protein